MTWVLVHTDTPEMVHQLVMEPEKPRYKIKRYAAKFSKLLIHTHKLISLLQLI